MDAQVRAQAITDLRAAVTQHLADADASLDSGDIKAAALSFYHAETSLAAIYSILRLAK